MDEKEKRKANANGIACAVCLEFITRRRFHEARFTKTCSQECNDKRKTPEFRKSKGRKCVICFRWLGKIMSNSAGGMVVTCSKECSQERRRRADWIYMSIARSAKIRKLAKEKRRLRALVKSKKEEESAGWGFRKSEAKKARPVFQICVICMNRIPNDRMADGLRTKTCSPECERVRFKRTTEIAEAVADL